MILPQTGQISVPQSPLADLGALLWGNVRDSASIPRKKIQSTLYALDSRDGSVRWSYALQGQDSESQIILDHGMIYSNATDSQTNGAGYIFALDSATGKLLWKDKARPLIDMSAARLVNGVLYVSSGDGTNATTVYALRTGDGAPLWSYPINASDVNSTAQSSGTLYLGSTDGIVYALRVSNGKLLWHYQTNL
jgi:outer membrane protein assembly factor BamB